MVRPIGRPMARKPITLEDLREEFLAHCEARNLSSKTVEWYDDRTRRFADWCATQGIDSCAGPKLGSAVTALAVASLPPCDPGTPSR